MGCRPLAQAREISTRLHLSCRHPLLFCSLFFPIKTRIFSVCIIALAITGHPSRARQQSVAAIVCYNVYVEVADLKSIYASSSLKHASRSSFNLEALQHIIVAYSGYCIASRHCSGYGCYVAGLSSSPAKQSNLRPFCLEDLHRLPNAGNPYRLLWHPQGSALCSASHR